VKGGEVKGGVWRSVPGVSFGSACWWVGDQSTSGGKGGYSMMRQSHLPNGSTALT
jgi:hypothetical protein